MSPATVRLKHISRFKDRHGHLRHYLRIPGRKPVALPGAPGSPEFMAAYNAEVAASAQEATRGPAQPPAGSLDALAASYYRSAAYAALRASTQRAYRRIVEELRASHGRHPVKLLDAEGVRRLIAAKDRPTAKNHRLRILRALCAHAVEAGMLAADPTVGVRRTPYRTEGYATWSEAEIAAYEARWPTGSRQRLALALLLYTGQRRSDVVRMGRQHLGPSGLEVRQVKTWTRLTIPVHPALAAELAHVPADQLTFLVTAWGPAFTAAGFYGTFREWCDAAGLPKGRSPHGLRKACGRRLAEAGCTEHQIMAVLGVTAAVAAIYTRAASQQSLARDAMARIGNVVRMPDFQPSSNPGQKRRKR